ncbi:MAG: phosphoribosylformimino-5-aminoimidazole carboxamide ribotide isomerase [Lachnospiraceae bacterium]|nr:phosphoribosylformimino-5-aminoimidazole carboxamide ribotide isomerase [Lachnospiraceae bacterium]
MKLRPCIDIHNGAVKQIIGASLKDEQQSASENFVSKKNAAYYAGLYSSLDLDGGHVIILNKAGDPYYEASKAQALEALRAFPNGMSLGGGVNPENAATFLDAGASHVIVTSYVFKEGKIDYYALTRMVSAVGKDRLILDLSCKKKDDEFVVATDRWQSLSHVVINGALLDELSEYCDEFLIHAADVEGKRTGIETDLLPLLCGSRIPVTYAGGVHSLDDIDLLKLIGDSKIDVTIGSALSIFGGDLDLKEAAERCAAEI